MKQDLITINTDKINSLILEIDSSTQKINKILENIASTYSKINKDVSYQGTQTYSAKERVVYDMIRVIRENFETYKEELMSVKKNFATTSSKVANEINQASRNVQSKAPLKAQVIKQWKY